MTSEDELTLQWKLEMKFLRANKILSMYRWSHQALFIDSIEPSRSTSSAERSSSRENQPAPVEDYEGRIFIRNRLPANGTSDKKDFDSFVGNWQNDYNGTEDAVSDLASELCQMLKIQITRGETYGQRLDKLPYDENNREGSRKFETDVTQPFVNGVLRTCLETFNNRFKACRADKATATKAEEEYLRESSIHLYTEKKAGDDDKIESDSVVTSKEQHHRMPDAAFFRRGSPVQKNEEIIFDKSAREIGMLLSVEAKRELDSRNKNAALLECERDFAVLSSRTPSHQMRVGFSIITDGVDWYFVRMHWKYNFVDCQKWERKVEISPKLTFGTTAEPTELARWILFVRDLSLSEQFEDTGLNRTTKIILEKKPSGPQRLVQVIRKILRPHKKLKPSPRQLNLIGVFSSGKRAGTSLWEEEVASGEKRERFVLKHFEILEEVPERDAMLEEYYLHELKYLQDLGGTPNIVSLASDLPTFTRNFWLKYEGIPLEEMDICGKRGQQLACIVKDDIYTRALSFLTERCIAHGDIHQSNVVVCLENHEHQQGKAVLIDFESAREFKERFHNSPQRGPLQYLKESSQWVDKIAVGALLKCLWDTQCCYFDDAKIRPIIEDLANKVTNNDERMLQTIVNSVRPAIDQATQDSQDTDARI